jgi:predicted Zn-dependent peptidase
MKNTLLAITLILLSFTIGNAQATTYKWQQVSQGKYSYNTVVGDPMQVRHYTLANGLKVIISVNKEKPRVQTLIAVKAGSKTDPSTNTGLAHYLEHMLFKGTDNYGSADWANEKPLLDIIDNLYEQYNSTTDPTTRTQIYSTIDSVSGVAAKYAIANEYDKMMTMIGAKGTNAFTSFEQTVYVNDIPSNQINKWITIEAERFRNPVFRIFHTELEAVYEEKNRALDDDGDKVYETLFAALFKNHNYGLQTTIGTIDHLKNPSLKEIRKYFYSNYVPNNMAIILVGDIQPDSVVNSIAEAFGNMAFKQVKPYTFVPEEPISKPIVKNIYGPDAESVVMAYRLPGANSKDAMLLDIISSILSNGNAGLMDLNLVKKQKVLDASAGAYILKDYSLLFAEGKSKQGQNLEQVQQLILDEIEKIKKGSFDEDIIKAIINNYKRQLVERNESNAGRAYTMLDKFVTDVDWLKTCTELNEISNITKADIVSFANKYFANNYACIYKRIGEDKSITKVDKPTITPVSVNRDMQSNFVSDIGKMKANEVKPVFIDYNKDITKGKVNGADLLTVRNTTNNLYTLYYYLPMGKLHNKLLPVAVEYLQYLGTPTRTAEQVSKQFYQTAASFGVSCADDESYVYIDGLQENFLKDVGLFEQLINTCLPNEAALKELIADIKKKRADAKLDKNKIRRGLSQYATYGGKNPFNNVLSNTQLDAITPQQLIDVLHSLTSNNHTILYYGKLPLQAIQNQLTKVHKLPAKLKVNVVANPYAYKQQNENEVLFTNYDMVQAELSWVRNGTAYNSNQAPMVSLFNEYFGGGMSGVVFQDIRESKALAYSTYASYTTPSRNTDPFTTIAYVGCQSDKMKESITAMNNLLNNLPESDKMLNQAKEAIINVTNTSRITKTNILFNYLNAQKMGHTSDIREQVYNTIPQLNMSKVKEVHKNNFSNKPYTLCVVANKDKIDKEVLQQFGNITQLTLTDIFGY